MAYTPEEQDTIFTEICRRIAQEGYSLRKTLLDPDFPSYETFYKWLESSDEKSKQYARACEERQELIVEDIFHIADHTARDTKIVDINGTEVELTDHEHINRSKIRIDARKWYLGKVNPKKYGNKIDITTDGNPLNMTDEQKDKRIAELMALAKEQSDES